MNSIIQSDKCCYICGSYHWIECHHVYGGANRKISEQYGLKVFLCHVHHNEPPRGVHFDKELRALLQDVVQRKAMQHYNWTERDFINMLGKSYLL